MSGHYPDKPPTASNGHSFEELGESLFWRFFGERIGVFKDRWSQYNIGESRGRVEFKELQNSHTRLHIEIAEKTRIDRAWVSSGIMRADNTKRYACGNCEDIFVFYKERLRTFYREVRPREVWFGRDLITGIYRLGGVGDGTLAATIHSFVLDKPTADKLCIYRFQWYGGDWHVCPGAQGRLSAPSAPPSIEEVCARGSRPEDWAWWEWTHDQLRRTA